MEIMIPQNRALEEMKLNDFLYQNTIYLDCEIDRESQVMFCRQLRKLSIQELAKPKDEQKHIKVRISSFGGAIVSVFAMVSDMEYWQEQGIIIETYCDGYCASGGSKILMAGSKGYRYITRYGWVLFHQPQYGGHSCSLQEKINDLKYDLKDWEVLKSMMRKHTKLTEEDIDNFTEKNLDFTYYPEECLEKSIVDKII
jgi:ATP-dependent Clp protease protease subunit